MYYHCAQGLEPATFGKHTHGSTLDPLDPLPQHTPISDMNTESVFTDKCLVLVFALESERQITPTMTPSLQTQSSVVAYR
jgi:hypothetical protein